jgi:hypothetical protein
VDEFAPLVSFPPDPNKQRVNAWSAFDYWPLSDKDILVYLLRGTTLEVYEGRGRLVEDSDSKAKVWKHDWRRREADDISNCPFKESFRVFAKGDVWYFLTASGKLYISKKKPDGKGRSMTLLWDNKDQPIRGSIVFVDEDKTYLFGKETRAIINATDFFYMELCEQPKAKGFNAKDLKSLKGPEPLKTLAEYTQLIREREKLPAKKPDAKP